MNIEINDNILSVINKILDLFILSKDEATMHFIFIVMEFPLKRKREMLTENNLFKKEEYILKNEKPSDINKRMLTV